MRFRARLTAVLICLVVSAVVIVQYRRDTAAAELP
jgi:hypothetical protein